MLKVFGFYLCFASFNTVRCALILPQVFIPELKIYPQNPPRVPLLCLTEEKFLLPQFCQNSSEWENVDMSLKILTDYSEPDPERSTFASFINLIKFILIKEELTCLDAITGPLIQVQRPEGKIFKDNSEILNDIETALSKKPKTKVQPVTFYDNIDISNMIPAWRPRGPCRRKDINAAPIVKAIKSNSTCVCPKAAQSLSPFTIIGGNLNPITKGMPPKPCPRSMYQQLALQPNKLQSLPSTNIKPVVLGYGGNCNLCQRMASPVLAGCPKLTTPFLTSYSRMASPVLAGCPKLASAAPGAVLGCGCPKANMILGGCPYSNPLQPQMLNCSKCGLANCDCQNQAVSVLQREAIPVIDCYGNLMKQVKTTYLVPFTMQQTFA